MGAATAAPMPVAGKVDWPTTLTKNKKMQFFDKIVIWRIVDSVAAKLTRKNGGDTLKLFASNVLMVLSVSK